MILRDIVFENPSENIVFDEVLLRLAETSSDEESVRLWESSVYFVVLGRICKMEDDIDMDGLKRDQIPFFRRCSGGGTVLQGPGCLNYSLILSKEKHPELRDLRRSYEVILSKIVRELLPMGIEAVVLPISDIALKEDEKKFSGNAQKRGKKFILHHGTILYNFDLTRIERYLKMPLSVPEYRRGRAHHEFVGNLSLSQRQVKEVLERSFPFKKKVQGLSTQENKLLQEFLNTKNPLLAKGEDDDQC